MDTNARSIAKSISYRVLGSASTAGIVFVLNGDLTIALGAGAIDSVVKLLAYYFHERLWDRIPFGRQKPPEYEI